ncbi:MAG: antitoxin [Planctomycetes bacterium]|nr:antitoxin [Planctomycetota bacterium]
MSRISIDVTPQEHQRLKAMAALQGKSIKEFVLASTLGSQFSATKNGASEEQDLAELEAILDQRIQEAETAGVSTRTIEGVFQQAREEASRTPDA